MPGISSAYLFYRNNEVEPLDCVDECVFKCENRFMNDIMKRL